MYARVTRRTGHRGLFTILRHWCRGMGPDSHRRNLHRGVRGAYDHRRVLAIVAVLSVFAALLGEGGVAFAQGGAYCRASWTDRIRAARVVASYLIPAGEGRIVTVPPASRAGAVVYLARGWGLSGDMERGGCGYVVVSSPAGGVLVEAPPPGNGMVLWEVQVIEVDEVVPVDDRRSPADALSAAFGGANLGEGLRRYLTMPLMLWLLSASVGMLLAWRTIASIRAAPETRYDESRDDEEVERWVE